MRRRLSKFRLRSLLLFVAIACVGLAGWRRIQEYKLLAHGHHYSALKAGYRAIEIQGTALDRSAMEAAYPRWEQSVRHSQLADYYMQVTKKPWIIVLSTPPVDSLPELPDDDLDLPAWWQHNLANHVRYNGLNRDWGSYLDDAVIERNLALINIRSASFNYFLALSHPELFAECPEFLPGD